MFLQIASKLSNHLSISIHNHNCWTNQKPLEQCMTEHYISTDLGCGAGDLVEAVRVLGLGGLGDLLQVLGVLHRLAGGVAAVQGHAHIRAAGPATLATSIPTTEQFSLQAAPRQLGQRRGGRRGGGGRGCHRDPGGLRVQGAAGVVWLVMCGTAPDAVPAQTGATSAAESWAEAAAAAARRPAAAHCGSFSRHCTWPHRAAWQHTRHTFACVNI